MLNIFKYEILLPSIIMSTRVFSLLIIEHTLDRSRSYIDCFIDPTVNKESDGYVSYYLRMDIFFSPNTCYTSDQIAFKQPGMP